MVGMTVDVSNTGSVLAFEPRPISEVFMGQQIAKKCTKDTQIPTEDGCKEIGAYRDVDRKWMSLDHIVSNTPGRIVPNSAKI
jgi:hypothetical protein